MSFEIFSTRSVPCNLINDLDRDVTTLWLETSSNSEKGVFARSDLTECSTALENRVPVHGKIPRILSFICEGILLYQFGRLFVSTRIDLSARINALPDPYPIVKLPALGPF